MEDATLAPKAKKVVTEKLANRPVRFTASVGTLWIRPSKPEPIEGGLVPVAGLRVLFTPSGVDTDHAYGGFSHDFFPDLHEHDEDNDLCDCAQCLADVREFIANKRNADVVRQHGVREVDPDAGVKIPFAKWNNPDLSANDLPATWASTGFDLEEALRYERKSLNREGIITALEALIADADVVTESDVLSAEVELD